jgi:hypothetical protein
MVQNPITALFKFLMGRQGATTCLDINALASLQPCIARVSSSSARTQGTRRQMAKLSERNLYSNISTTVKLQFCTRNVGRQARQSPRRS